MRIISPTTGLFGNDFEISKTSEVYEIVGQSRHWIFRNWRRNMTLLMKTLAATVSATYLLFVWPGLIAWADEKKHNAENGTRNGPATLTEPKPIPVEVRFTDNSLLKLKLEGERLEFLTSYGKLFIPVSDVHRIDFATRVSPESTKRIQTAIKSLGSSEFQQRETASAELLSLGFVAYPSLLEASKDKDLEIVRRAGDLLEKVCNSVPAEERQIRKHDVIQTEDSKISGWVQGTALRATTAQFGSVQLKLADLRSLRSLAVPEPEEDSAAVSDPGNLVNYQNQVGKTFTFRVTGAINGSIWGTDIYTADSNLASAAVHAGVLKAGQTKNVRVKIVASPQAFQASNRNGVTTTAYGPYPGAFQILR